MAKKYVGLDALQTFLDNLKETFLNLGHKHTVSDLTDYTVDSSLSSTSTNPVQNKVLDAEFDVIATAMNSLESAIDGKSDSGHNHDSRYYQKTEIDTKLASKSDSTHNHDSAYDVKGSAASALTEAKSHAETVANTAANTVKNDLLNGAGGAYDTLKELADLINENQDAIDALETVATNKANTIHSHTISEVTNLQITLDTKSDIGHTHSFNDLEDKPFGEGHEVIATWNGRTTGLYTGGYDGSQFYRIADYMSKDELFGATVFMSDGSSFVIGADNTMVLDDGFMVSRYTIISVPGSYSNDEYYAYFDKGGVYAADEAAWGAYVTQIAKSSVDTLDEKFIPNSIARTVDVDTAIENLANAKMDKANPTGAGSLSLNRKANTTVGTNSVAVGYNNEASGNYSYAEGIDSKATDYAAHAEGDRTTASATGAHAEGQNTVASGLDAHAEGRGTTASGYHSHAQGIGTIASGTGSHAEGTTTTAEGMYSHAEGSGTVAKGYQTHAEGSGTIAAGSDQHVQGRYNVETPYRYAHIVGNGSSDTARSNMHTLDWSGNAWFAGNIKVGGASEDDVIASRLISEADTNWVQIYDSGEITSQVNAFANINISGYKKLMMAIKCVNDGTNASSKNGAVTFTATNGTKYQFNCWTTMFSNAAYTSGCMATFEVNNGWLICPNASRTLRASNFLGTEGGTVDNLNNTGSGIMKCTNTLSTMMISTVDNDANYYFLAGSRVIVWGCQA